MVIFIGGGRVASDQRMALFRYVKELKKMGITIYLVVTSSESGIAGQAQYSDFSFLVKDKSYYFYVPNFSQLSSDVVKRTTAQNVYSGISKFCVAVSYKY